MLYFFFNNFFQHKQLPGGWGVLHDGGGKDNKSPYIELFSEANAATPLHTLRLEHLKFLDKSYLQQETYFVLSVKKEKHHLDFDSLEDKEDWVQALCHVSAELWKQRAQERESSSCDGSDNSLSMNENLLYDSFDKGQCLWVPWSVSFIASLLLSGRGSLMNHLLCLPQ